MRTKLSNLPSVEQLLQTNQGRELIAAFGRPLTLDAIRNSLKYVRKLINSGSITIPDNTGVLNQAGQFLMEWTTSTFRPVINASGVILHTNLGRAPLSLDAVRAIQLAAQGYSTLEFDLASGKRGSRTAYTDLLLQKLTGAESALVVNNNASAVLLILTALAKGKRIIISRTQLVEIGGSFRIPDVMKQSGAKLIEVGTTNKVHLRDYREELAEGAALVLRAHRSNFKIVGFTEEPEIDKIAKLSHEYGVPLVDDLGSGALMDTEKFGLGHEPTIQESLAAGADLICFSGDKLVGGPQAGIIIGRKDLLDKLKKHPLNRALRADKLCFAALNATLLHYLKDEATKKIPVWRMISMTQEQIRTRADAWREALGMGEVVRGESMVGGGSLPEECLPTYGLLIKVRQTVKFLNFLRTQDLPIIARLVADKIFFDPRTVFVEQDEMFVSMLKSSLKEFQ